MPALTVKSEAVRHNTGLAARNGYLWRPSYEDLEESDCSRPSSSWRAQQAILMLDQTDDRELLQKTSEGIRSAFARGDVATIMAYHHPDVIKALSFRKYLTGRDPAEADLRGTPQQFSPEFEENHVESLLIQGDTAVEQTIFCN